MGLYHFRLFFSRLEDELTSFKINGPEGSRSPRNVISGASRISVLLPRARPSSNKTVCSPPGFAPLIYNLEYVLCFQQKPYSSGPEGSRTPDLFNANEAFYQTELQAQNSEL